MSATVPENYHDLLEGPVVVSFTTLMPDGMPQTTPVWCLWDGENVLINTTKSRQKACNVRTNPKVNVMALDPTNPYRYVEIRGEVVNITEEGGLENINQLAKLYRGVDSYYGGVTPADLQERETREIITIKPVKVSAMG